MQKYNPCACAGFVDYGVCIVLLVASVCVCVCVCVCVWGGGGGGGGGGDCARTHRNQLYADLVTSTERSAVSVSVQSYIINESW